MKVNLKFLVIVALLSSLPGCSSMNFYSQAVKGQLQLLWNRRSLEVVLADPSTNSEVKKKLELARDVLSFAEQQLGLPVEGSYSSYVDTGKPFVIWNVFAADEFSIELQTFCYPIAGCVSYRGFFEEAAAREFAANLQSQGYEVFVGGVAAYSTLGWFDDPVLNTFLNRSDEKLAALLFHELAHKVVYIPGDTRFNESFATAVERIALSRWLEARVSESKNEPDKFLQHLASQKRSQEVIQLIANTRVLLAEIYRQEMSDSDKKNRKIAVIASLRSQYHTLRERWYESELGTTFPEFEFWMQGDINNARLGTVADYNDLVPAFEQLYQEKDANLVRFLQACQALSSLSNEERLIKLEQMATLNAK